MARKRKAREDDPNQLMLFSLEEMSGEADLSDDKPTKDLEVSNESDEVRAGTSPAPTIRDSVIPGMVISKDLFNEKKILRCAQNDREREGFRPFCHSERSAAESKDLDLQQKTS